MVSYKCRTGNVRVDNRVYEYGQVYDFPVGVLPPREHFVKVDSIPTKRGRKVLTDVEREAKKVK